MVKDYKVFNVIVVVMLDNLNKILCINIFVNKWIINL